VSEDAVPMNEEDALLYSGQPHEPVPIPVFEPESPAQFAELPPMPGTVAPQLEFDTQLGHADPGPLGVPDHQAFDPTTVDLNQVVAQQAQMMAQEEAQVMAQLQTEQAQQQAAPPQAAQAPQTPQDRADQQAAFQAQQQAQAQEQAQHSAQEQQYDQQQEEFRQEL
jgi:hypothetical protein